MMEALYKKVIQQVEPSNLVVMGDSAGGGLALALVEKMGEENIAMPNQTILISPWLDVRMNNPKIAEIEENEVRFEELHCEDSEYLIVAFGSCARIAQKAMEMAREEGIKVGLLRPITLWPFPSKAIAARAAQVKGILTVELNAGQMVEDVRLAVKCKVPVEHFGRLGGIVPDPDEVITALKEKLIK